MKSILTVAGLFLSIGAAKDTPELKGDTFYGEVVDADSKAVLSHKPWFIDFYSPWCKHCKQLAPTWDELYEKHEGSLNVAKVDCSKFANNELCNQFDVRQLPTLVYLPAGTSEFHRYDGGGAARALEDLEEFAL